MDLSNMIIKPPAPPNQERGKPLVSDTYRNPPAPPEQENIKPRIIDNEIDFDAILKELEDAGIFDCEDEYRFSDLTSSSDEEGEIKDDSPEDMTNKVVVKKEPVDKNEINQEKGDLEKRLMSIKMISDYQSDDSNDSIEFLCDRTKEDKIIFEHLSSSEEDESIKHSKEKKHRVHKKQKQEIIVLSDEDTHYSCPLPPDHFKEDELKETLKKNEESTKIGKRNEEKIKERKFKEEKDVFKEEPHIHGSYTCDKMPQIWEKKHPERGNISNNNILQAVEMVVKENKSIEGVAASMKISKSANGKDLVFKGNLVCEKIFTASQETMLNDYVLKTSSFMKYGLTSNQVRTMIYQYGSALKLNLPTSWTRNKTAGKDWFYGFMDRHPKLTLRSPEATSIGRTSSFNKSNICHVTMTSEVAYHNHMRGKRHLKALKLKNAPLVVASTITAAALEGNSKYPLPSPGMTREKVNRPASIQAVLEKINNSKIPFPGLESVTEIQTATQLKYYCCICDAVCTPDTIVSHLQGFKHRFCLLKKFDPKLADSWSNKSRNNIDPSICRILYRIQRERGLGKMAVEIDRPNSSSSSQYYDSQPSTSRGTPSTSRRPDSGFEDYYQKASQPNPKKPGYYCDVCLSHMNCQSMWESHIRGKRHLTNLKKRPGDLPSKTKTLPAVNVRPRLLDLLDDVEADIVHNREDLEPIVGLENVQETQSRETNSEMYNCFLCGACTTSLDIYDHLISYKHRMKYLEHINNKSRFCVNGIKDPETAETILRDICISIEYERGRGRPVVFVTKAVNARLI